MWWMVKELSQLFTFAESCLEPFFIYELFNVDNNKKMYRSLSYHAIFLVILPLVLPRR